MGGIIAGWESHRVASYRFVSRRFVPSARLQPLYSCAVLLKEARVENPIRAPRNKSHRFSDWKRVRETGFSDWGSVDVAAGS